MMAAVGSLSRAEPSHVTRCEVTLTSHLKLLILFLIWIVSVFHIVIDSSHSRKTKANGKSKALRDILSHHAAKRELSSLSFP